MGKLVAWRCAFCQYEEPQLAVGNGRENRIAARLFICPNCKSVGSSFVRDDGSVICSICYHKDIQLLADTVRHAECPKCGEPGEFRVLEGEWQ